jgi:hypothetical protein
MREAVREHGARRGAPGMGNDEIETEAALACSD